MEWVETRGRTVEEAKDRALDELGVAVDDAEFEVLEEGGSALFGLRRTEARVRARVRPQAPRPKVERRDRQRRGRGNGRGRDAQADESSASEKNTDAGSRQRPKNDAPAAPAAPRASSQPKQEHVMSDETFADADQEAAVRQFLETLLTSFGLEGDVATSMDDGTLRAEVNGANLGLLIGPRGGTLRAIQELTWTTLQREAAGRESATVRLDVSGYAERRRAALRDFAVEQAELAVSSGSTRVLEPMNAADRKAVHDALVDFAGVRTLSEGDEPRRRVVIVVAAD